MELNEMIAKIVAVTGVSEEEAKAALELNGNDMLEAVISLERAGKINKTAQTEDTANETEEEAAEKIEEDIERLEGDVVNKDGKRAGTTGEKAMRFGESVKRLVNALLKQTFQVERKGEEILAVPVLVFLLVLIFGFNIVIPLLIVGLFLGCHYHFIGVDKMTFDVNEMSKTASKYAEDIKSEFQKK